MPTTIYAVLGTIEFEGDILIGLFSTEEKARETVKRLESGQVYKYAYPENFKFSIEPRTLDKEVN